MANLRDSWQSTHRMVDRVFDGLRARPVGILVFACSVLLLVYLQLGVQGTIRVDAVAMAVGVDHPARISSFVVKTYVEPGDPVDAGAPLLDLSPHFIDRELARVDAEVEKLLRESKLAQARLVVEEQRWLDPDMRLRPAGPSLERPTEALYAEELAVLQVRRSQLLEDREALTISAARAGRVVSIATAGVSVAPGTSVALIAPEFADQIVAYVPAETKPAVIAIGAPVQISRPAFACDRTGTVLRRGAVVEEAPGQLRNVFRFPVHGMPVYISIPEGCSLGIGQVLTVEFPRAVL